MRVYVIGTMLLDLDDPTRVLAHSRTPLLFPGTDERDCYVPDVVYSCGVFLHDGLLWIPYGVDDSRIGVAYAPLGEVLADLSSSLYAEIVLDHSAGAEPRDGAVTDIRAVQPNRRPDSVDR